MKHDIKYGLYSNLNHPPIGYFLNEKYYECCFDENSNGIYRGYITGDKFYYSINGSPVIRGDIKKIEDRITLISDKNRNFYIKELSGD